MDNYPLYFLIAFVTVLSPGPGVLMSIHNAVSFGIKGALPGILGISIGTFIVASLSATGLGLLLASSELAFNTLKIMGALYLLYLGVKLWFSPALNLQPTPHNHLRSRQWLQGIMMQLSNPKTAMFFIAIFPQFVDLAHHQHLNFFILVSTYSLLVVVIHLAYALIALKARHYLQENTWFNRLSGMTFVGFASALALSQQN